MSVLEKPIEDDVVDWAKARDILVFKLNLWGNNGWPDRLFVLPFGTHIYIEFKKPGERPTALQEHRLQTLTKRKVHAYWSDNFYDATALLEAALLSERSNAAHDFSSLRRITPRSGLG